MLLGVNAVLVCAMTLLLVIDFERDSHMRIAEKQRAMLAEVKLIAPVLYRLSQVEKNHDSKARQPGDGPVAASDPDAQLLSSYQRSLNLWGSAVFAQQDAEEKLITTFLRAARDRNECSDERNYQLAASVNGHWYQVKKSSSQPYLSANGFRSLGDSDTGVVATHDHEMMVTRESIPNGMVYIAESLTVVRRDALTLLMWHTIGLAFIGLGVMALIDLILVRLVSQPLVSLVGTVRQIRHGDLGSSAPSGSCREVASLVSGVNRLSWQLDRAEQRRLSQLEKARRMQEHLFPKPLDGPVRVHCIHRAANAVGGDYYDHKVMPDGSVIVILADVSGHGVAAAMGAAMLKTLFDSMTDRYTSPVEIIDGINRGFHKVSLDEDFATVVVIRIDTKKRRMQYVNAGHETIYVLEGVGRHAPGVFESDASDWQEDGGDESQEPVESYSNSRSSSAVAVKPSKKTEAVRGIRELKSNGPLIGVMPDIEWEAEELPFASGDRVVIYTDGITEARSKSQGLLGRKRFLEMLSWNQKLELGCYCRTIVREVDEFREGLHPTDDVTLLALEY